MVRLAGRFLILLLPVLATTARAQGDSLFGGQEPITLSFRASIKALKGDTNDSTYLGTTLSFSTGDAAADSVEIRIRARGHARRELCFYPPLALRFSETDVAGSPFVGQQEVKLVLPCQAGAAYEDYVLREFLAYKLFEQVSPYFYQTRLVQLLFTEERGNRERGHRLTAFLLEDHGAVARRLKARRVRQQVAPQMQDALAGIRDNLFQYMIGNTDYSMRLQHNQRLFYIGEAYVSLPYDFDMSGLVNAPYAAVNNVQHVDGNISEVTQRLYKGYARDTVLMQQVRQEFLAARPRMEGWVADLEPLFSDHQQWVEAREYLASFFRILEDERLFERRILKQMCD